MVLVDDMKPVAVITRDDELQSEVRYFIAAGTLTIERLHAGDFASIQRLDLQSTSECIATMRALVAEHQSKGFVREQLPCRDCDATAVALAQPDHGSHTTGDEPLTPVCQRHAPAGAAPIDPTAEDTDRTAGASDTAAATHGRTAGATETAPARTDDAITDPTDPAASADEPVDRPAVADPAEAVRELTALLIAHARTEAGHLDRFAAMVRLQQHLQHAAHQAYVSGAIEADALAKAVGNNVEAAQQLTDRGYPYKESGLRKLRDVARAALAGARSHQP